MVFGRYQFKVEKAKADHKCGKCRHIIKKGDRRLVIEAGGYGFPSRLCWGCAMKICMFINLRMYKLLPKHQR